MMSLQEVEGWHALEMARLHLRHTLAIIADGGFREAPEFRPRVFGYRVSSRALRMRLAGPHLATGGPARVTPDMKLPFGWTAIPERRTATLYVEPWWLLGPKILARWACVRWCEFAIRVGMAEEPYECCYLHELRWFPTAPRFE